MLRLVLLALYLAALFSSGPSQGDLHGNLDPNGAQATLPGEAGGGWDPDGSQAAPGDLHGNLDPNGHH